MERTFNVHEALKILKRHFITDNPQMVSRYIREGRLYAERATKKDGWKIKEDDLYEFIEEEKPGIVAIISVYDQYIDGLLIPKKNEKIMESDNVQTSIEQLSRKVEKLAQTVESLLVNKDVDTKVTEKENPHETKSYDEFISHLVGKKKINEIEKKQSEIELKQVYGVYYKDGKLRAEVKVLDGFMCPITHEVRKKFLPLLNGTFEVLYKMAKENRLGIKEVKIEET